MARRPVILIVGGGYVDLYTALRLQKKLSDGQAEIVVVDPQPHMTYQPFLPEAAAGSVEPRHVVVRCDARSAAAASSRAITGVSHAHRRACVAPPDGQPFELGYDVLVMAAGSVARTAPMPGLAEHGVGIKTIGEGIHLRNHDLASASHPPRQPDADDRPQGPHRRRLAAGVLVQARGDRLGPGAGPAAGVRLGRAERRRRPICSGGTPFRGAWSIWSSGRRLTPGIYSGDCRFEWVAMRVLRSRRPHHPVREEADSDDTACPFTAPCSRRLGSLP